MAMEAALDKGAEFCGTQESRLEVLGQIAGVEVDDSEEALDGGPGTDPVGQRKWVVARAEQKMAADESPFDALESTWAEVDDEVNAEVNDPDPDDGGDGDDEEAEAGAEDDDPLDEVLDAETEETDAETEEESDETPDTEVVTDPEPVDAD